MNPITIGGACVVIATTAALPMALVGSAQSQAADTSDLQSDSETVDKLICQGGGSGSFEVSVDPYSVRTDPSGAQIMDLDVVVESKLSAVSAVQLEYLFVDKLGNALGGSQRPNAMVLTSHGSDSFAAHTPALAKDGYFMMRIIAAGTDGEDEVFLETERYFQIAGGAVIPITSDEWFNADAIPSDEEVAR